MTVFYQVLNGFFHTTDKFLPVSHSGEGRTGTELRDELIPSKVLTKLVLGVFDTFLFHESSQLLTESTVVLTVDHERS